MHHNQRFVIDELLSGKSREEKIELIIAHLEEVAAKINNNEISLEGLAIMKQLTKNPEDYSDKKGLPHVNVALRLNSKRGKKLRQGDTVPYLICQDGSTLAATQRAYHPEELKMNDKLKIEIMYININTVYYLANQIHPVISRICSPIEELDAARIAASLGLDASSYKSKALFDNDENADSTLGGWTQMTDEERFKDCTRLVYSCPACKQDVTVEGIFNGNDLEMKLKINRCNNFVCKVTSAAIYRILYEKLIKTLRLFVQQYYRGYMSCDSAGCGYRSTTISLAFTERKYRCPVCEKGRLKQEFPASKLHKQLSYYIYLFDFDRVLQKSTPAVKVWKFDPVWGPYFHLELIKMILLYLVLRFKCCFACYLVVLQIEKVVLIDAKVADTWCFDGNFMQCFVFQFSTLLVTGEVNGIKFDMYKQKKQIPVENNFLRSVKRIEDAKSGHQIENNKKKIELFFFVTTVFVFYAGRGGLAAALSLKLRINQIYAVKFLGSLKMAYTTIALAASAKKVEENAIMSLNYLLEAVWSFGGKKI
uniref:DNA-directed DNA polymerase n=1 Tax=Strigamia maritima TaxID=126957 RepID=T1JKN1_STRMM